MLRSALVLIALVAGPLAAQLPDSARADSLARAARVDTLHAHQLAPQVVSGTRLTAVEGERAAARVDAIDPARTPPGPGAAADALRALPGVSAVDDQGNRLQPTIDLRGFTVSPVVGAPQGVSVFLDGVRVNEADAQQVYFDLLPMEAVRSAELVRGPSALYGKNSLAGSLLLFTRRGTDTPVLDAELARGPWGYDGATLTAGGRTRGLDGFLMARASREDGWRDDTPATTRMLFATLGRRTAGSDLALSVLAARDRIMQAGSLPESWYAAEPRANFTPGDYFRPDLLHAALRGTRALGGGELRANAFARRNDTEQFNVNVGAPSTLANVLTRSAGATAEWTRPLALGIPASLTLGGEYARNDVRYHIWSVPDGAPATESEDARVPQDDAALYAQLVVSLSDATALTAAARGDFVRVPFRDLQAPANSGTSTFRRLSPRLGLTHRFARSLHGYVDVGGGFRAPAALELACADEQAPCPLPFALGDDPPLAPVRVWNSEAGLDWAPLAGTAVSLSAYRAEVRDEIVFAASDTRAGYFRNVPRTRRQGAELSARAALPGGVHLAGSYALVDATYRSAVQLASAIDTTELTLPGDHFPLTPRQRATLSAGVVRLVGTLVAQGTLSARFLGTQYLRGDEPNVQPPLPGHGVADLHLALDGAHLGVTVDVTNLLDRRYATFGIYGENPSGPPGGPAPAEPVIERFLTPGYPRGIVVGVRVGK